MNLFACDTIALHITVLSSHVRNVIIFVREHFGAFPQNVIGMTYQSIRICIQNIPFMIVTKCARVKDTVKPKGQREIEMVAKTGFIVYKHTYVIYVYIDMSVVCFLI